MQVQVTTITAALQSLFDQTLLWTLAISCRFFQRARGYSLDQFVRILLFGWMEDPKASLESFAPRLGVSPQALSQRLDDRAELFARRLLQDRLRLLFAADPTRQRLLDRFTEVIAEDSTSVSLPADAADEWPGCGNHTGDHGKAAVKINVRYEVKTGRIDSMTLHPGKQNDSTLAAQPEDLPEGSLHLADLGYINTERWKRMGSERYFISRAKAKLTVLCGESRQPLVALLKSRPADTTCVDVPVQVHTKHQVALRMVALRCPQEVADQRKRKLRQRMKDKHGREPGEAALVLCEWTVLLTNVPVEMLSPEEVWVMYRVRWSVELWFKRGKQFGGWEHTHGRTQHRVLVELWMKMTGTLIVMWAALLRGGPLAAVSIWKRMRVARRHLIRIVIVWEETGAMSAKQWEEMLRAMDKIKPRKRKRTKPSSMDLLNEPRLATSGGLS